MSGDLFTESEDDLEKGGGLAYSVDATTIISPNASDAEAIFEASYANPSHV